jgi:hypothetical protein
LPEKRRASFPKAFFFDSVSGKRMMMFTGRI